jgi:DNA-binding FadR family transcriptional regulator
VIPAERQGEALRTLRRGRPLYQEVAAEIRSYIAEHRLEAGAPLPPEGELAKRLEVSRASVREAVKSLESVGIIEVRPGIGLFVAAFSFAPLLDQLEFMALSSIDEIREMLEVRRYLEEGMAEVAAARVTADQVAVLRQSLKRMRAAAAAGRYDAAEDREFHRLLFAHAENAVALRVADVFWNAFARSRQRPSIEPPDPMALYRAHVKVVDAFEAGDVDALKARIRDHYNDVLKRLERTGDHGSGGAPTRTRRKATKRGARS